MTEDLDLSPPEVPESSLFERILRYGLFLGAIFQIICILAIIVPTGKSQEQVETTSPVTNESRVSEPGKKPKAAAQQIRQKLKKESKKKR